VDTNLVLQGVELMLLGMGIVFGFLTLLVFTLRGMSLLADRLEVSDVAQPGAAAVTHVDLSDDRQLVAVISAAVARYRADRAK
jgi:oxaloacetate decarboxylase gamma subunit